MTVTTPENIQEKFAQHTAMCMQFIDRVRDSTGVEFRLNTNAMYLAIKSAYYDIERYKDFHQAKPQTDKSNSVKRAAYLCKWLNRVKPIEYQGEPPKPDDIYGLLINSQFAISMARTHIEAELKLPIRFSNKLRHELMYDFTYREVSADSILTIFQILFDLGKGEEPPLL